MADLEIRNLHVQAGEKQILKGVDLLVRSGEFHALMGPNGSGKSTLANVIMGHPNLEVTEGQIIFDGEDITEADPDERARAGLFMAFQYPVAIPGVTVSKYLRMVMNAHREQRGEAAISLKDFRKTGRSGDGDDARAARVLLPLPQRRLLRRREEAHGDAPARAPEAGARGARRDGLGPGHRRAQHVAQAVNTVAEPSGMGLLIITHYQRILHMVRPQFVHIMFEGRIVKQGGPELVEILEEKGYGWIREEVGAAA
jgi:Fe-S cluster assembly ATP-binding protein